MALVALAAAMPVRAQDTVRILVGFPPGGGADLMPTFTELGYPQIQGDGWFAFHAPARTPKATVDRMSSALGGAIRAPDVTERLLKIGFEPVGSSAEELAQRMSEDRARWAPIVKASGFSVDQ